MPTYTEYHHGEEDVDASPIETRVAWAVLEVLDDRSGFEEWFDTLSDRARNCLFSDMENKIADMLNKSDEAQ